MSLSRQSTAPAGDSDFFEAEKARLISEISTNFEELMTYTNVLNRKLEEVYGVGKEFDTVAQLWGQFNNIVRDKNNEPLPDAGVPGTGSVHLNKQ